MDHGRGDRVGKRESGYWLLDEGTRDLQAGTSGAWQETFTLQIMKTDMMKFYIA